MHVTSAATPGVTGGSIGATASYTGSEIAPPPGPTSGSCSGMPLSTSRSARVSSGPPMSRLLLPNRPFVSHASSVVLVEEDELDELLDEEELLLDDELLLDEELEDELLLDEEELLDELLLPVVWHCLCFAWNAGSVPCPSESQGGLDGGGLGVPLPPPFPPCPPNAMPGRMNIAVTTTATMMVMYRLLANVHPLCSLLALLTHRADTCAASIHRLPGI